VVRLKTLLARAPALLEGSDSPGSDMEVLLAHVLQQPRARLLCHAEQVLSLSQCRFLFQLLARRRAGCPVALLTGLWGFWSLELLVEPCTLIPRPDTESLVEQALLLCDEAPRRVLDLGTGTGAIALALACERPHWQVQGCDCMPEAVALAQRNAVRTGLDRVEFFKSDWFAALNCGARFDLIVSNPPYVASGDVHLSRGDLRFEPSSALVSGADGLDDIKRITAEAPAWLAEQGWLVLEHGYQQGAGVRSIMQAHGLVAVTTARDLAGHERVTAGRLPARRRRDPVSF